MYKHIYTAFDSPLLVFENAGTEALALTVAEGSVESLNALLAYLKHPNPKCMYCLLLCFFFLVDQFACEDLVNKPL